MNSMIRLSFVYCVLFVFTSCGIYSFSGASIDPAVKTVSVQQFPNKAAIVMPSLSQLFSDALRDKITSATNLSLTDKNADAQFTGAITAYNISFAAPTGNETAALNRLTITVQVSYKAKGETPTEWTTSFSRFANYDSNVQLSSVEEALIEEINEQLVTDIFNKAFIDW